MKFLSTFVLFAALIFFTAGMASAQDPVKTAPKAFTEKLNNDKVRVLEYSSKPGDKEEMHSHNPLVLYVIQGGKLKSTAPDGTSKVIEYKTGDVLWRDAITHSNENVGTTEVKALLVEMKQRKKK
jgi:beta-alanine degradation protein BauB